MAALVIPIHDLDNAGKDFVFALDQAWLTEVFADTPNVRGDASQGAGSVEVHAQRNGREILVHGKAHARLITECGRCLQDVTIDVSCDLAALYAPTEAPRRGAAPVDDDDDIDPDAPDREFYSGDQVVIDDLVRDYLLLELPMQPRCEPECDLPLRPASGPRPAGSNGKDNDEGAIDPRLMPLQKLAKGERDKE